MLFYVLASTPKLALLNICFKKLSNTTNMCKIATDMEFVKYITPARLPSCFILPDKTSILNTGSVFVLKYKLTLVIL